jgi:hypothetical protein
VGPPPPGRAGLAVCRELPLSALATHAFPFERAAEAHACADRKDDGLIHAALRYQGEADA